MATASCRGSGERRGRLPPTPASWQEAASPAAVASTAQGTGTAGARAQDKAGLRGPGPICWPASLRRGPGSTVCSVGGLAGGGLEVGQSQYHYHAALDQALCAPCEPRARRGAKQRGPTSWAAIWADRQETRGRKDSSSPKVTSTWRPSLSSPPTPTPLLPNFLSCRGSRASSQWPGLATNRCRWGLGSRGLSPLSSARHLPGSSAGPPSGQPHAGSGGGCEPKGPAYPPSAARVFACRTPGLLLGSPGHTLCSDTAPGVPTRMCLLAPAHLGLALPPWWAGSPEPGLLRW